MDLPHVVIVGGGFGGLYAARGLKNDPVEVTVIDRRNHHVFQPFLYQVATAALNPSDIAAPIRRILRRQKNASVLLGEAVSIDLEDRKVVLKDGEIRYDYLILSSGAVPSYFGHGEWEPHAPGLKDIEDALEIRKRIFLAYEVAERETDLSARERLLNFVVVGGGPTGVELAGALAEISRHALARDFRRIDPAAARVILVEAAPRLLGQFHPSMSDKAMRQLNKLGVEVMTGAPVEKIDAEGVVAGSSLIRSATVIWAAGVSASPLGKSLGVELDRAGRVPVQPDLSIESHSEVFVIGDLASVVSDGKPVPGVAPAAIQMGKHAAANIGAMVGGRVTAPFIYTDKGMLAAIGRAAAVASLPRVRLSGFIAWMTWLVVHIFYLIGFRNRVLVIIEWAWAYVTYERGARLITGELGPIVSEPADRGVKKS